MPQGSVLGPLLFALYIAPVSNVILAHGFSYHKYADNTHLYMAVQPGAHTTFEALSVCVNDVARWFLENGLLLNPDKTEAVLFGTSPQRKKIPTVGGIDVTWAVVPFRDTVKLLGVTLNSALSMDRHVTEVVRSCSYHTRALRHIRSLLTLYVAKSVGHSIVSSGLDYANALLHSTSRLISNLHRLQVAQNSDQSGLSGPRFVSATELRRSSTDVAKSVGHSIVSSGLYYPNALLHSTSRLISNLQNSDQSGLSGPALCQCHRVTSQLH